MAEYIERKALLRSLIELGYTICDKWNGIRDVILTEDSADVVPAVHGRWIDADYWASVDGRSIHYISKQCSICHKNVRRKSELPYCPNCGARMDGGNEDG